MQAIGQKGAGVENQLCWHSLEELNRRYWQSECWFEYRTVGFIRSITR